MRTDNGAVTEMEYNDALLRATKVIAANDAETITECGAGTDASTRWVKARSQIDATNWKSATFLEMPQITCASVVLTTLTGTGTGWIKPSSATAPYANRIRLTSKPVHKLCMVKELSQEISRRFEALLPPRLRSPEPVLPANLARFGSIAAHEDYVLSQVLLDLIRNFMTRRGETSVYYFLTESMPDQVTDFELLPSDLHADVLSELSPTESVFVGRNFDWALFTDHQGCLHVAGSEELHQLISELVSK